MRKAANCFKRAIEINPRKADAHNGLGQVFNDKKGVKADYNSAIQYYNRAIELEPKILVIIETKESPTFALNNTLRLYFALMKQFV